MNLSSIKNCSSVWQLWVLLSLFHHPAWVCLALPNSPETAGHVFWALRIRQIMESKGKRCKREAWTALWTISYLITRGDHCIKRFKICSNKSYTGEKGRIFVKSNHRYIKIEDKWQQKITYIIYEWQKSAQIRGVVFWFFVVVWGAVGLWVFFPVFFLFLTSKVIKIISIKILGGISLLQYFEHIFISKNL